MQDNTEKSKKIVAGTVYSTPSQARSFLRPHILSKKKPVTVRPTPSTKANLCSAKSETPAKSGPSMRVRQGGAMAPPGFTPGPLIKERDIELDWSPESVQEIKLRSSKKPQVRTQQDPASCADQEALLLSSVKKYPLDFQGLSQGQRADVFDLSSRLTFDDIPTVEENSDLSEAGKNVFDDKTSSLRLLALLHISCILHACLPAYKLTCEKRVSAFSTVKTHPEVCLNAASPGLNKVKKGAALQALRDTTNLPR